MDPQHHFWKSHFFAGQKSAGCDQRQEENGTDDDEAHLDESFSIYSFVQLIDGHANETIGTAW